MLMNGKRIVSVLHRGQHTLAPHPVALSDERYPTVEEVMGELAQTTVGILTVALATILLLAVLGV